MKNTDTPEESEIIIQKLPSDMGIHRNPRKGTLNAPERILEASDIGAKVLIDEVFPDEFSLEETHDRIERNIETLIEYERPLVSIGGDHSVSYPVLKVLKKKFPDLRLVWLDAHLDLKEKVNNHVSHDVVVRELLDNGFYEEDIVFVGITEIDHDEREFLAEHDLQVYMADEVGKFIDEYCFSDNTYMSVDIDVLKKAEAPGTGYPDGQLSVEEVEKVIEKVSPEYSDLVEVAPSLDEDEKTVENAKDILNTLVNEQKD